MRYEPSSGLDCVNHQAYLAAGSLPHEVRRCTGAGHSAGARCEVQLACTCAPLHPCTMLDVRGVVEGELHEPVGGFPVDGVSYVRFQVQHAPLDGSEERRVL